MKLLRNVVLAAWTLTLTVGAVAALSGTASAATATASTATGGVGAYDTGWG